MADKQISELVAASSVGASDLFVLEQSGTAKKLTGQILENWLVSFANGHGGIQSVAKTSTSGTNPVVDTYTITYADTTTSTFTVTNGIKGDTGAQTYVWIKWAAQQPTADNQMSGTPDAWMGVYVGLSSTAPAHYTDYAWYQIKGDKGDTGDAITLVDLTAGDHSPGSTDTYTVYAGDTAVGSFTVYQGLNGSGAVSSVNNVNPDANGNVALTAADIGIGAASSAPASDVVNGAVGTATVYARGDHRHELNVPISGTPANLGTASNGSSTNYARADHVHAYPDVFTKLWENQTPTASFAAQSVAVDLTSYGAILCKYSNGQETDGSCLTAIVFKNTTGMLMAPHESGSGGNFYRSCSPTDSGVAFGDGKKGGTGTVNTDNIPLAIYGIKGIV